MTDLPDWLGGGVSEVEILFGLESFFEFGEVMKSFESLCSEMRSSGVGLFRFKEDSII